MYSQRKQKLLHILQERNIDVAVVTSPTNIYYLTGFLAEPHERFFALALDCHTEQTILFLPALDEEAGKKAAQVDCIVPIADTDDPYKIFTNYVPLQIEQLALEKQVVTVYQYEQLKKLYANVEVQALDEMLFLLRKQKTREEIAQTKRAIQITEQGLAEILPQLRRGMTESEIKGLLEYTLSKLGAQGMAFDTLVLAGNNAANPHGTSGERTIAEGEFLLFDFGVTINGYHSDLTRTFIVGKPSEAQRQMYDAVLRANEAAIKAVKLNEPIKQIDLAARNVIREAGYGPYFIHRTGHGLGLDVHELPSIHEANEELISPGLLFTIEPGVYIPQLGGVRIEDNVYVDATGEVEVLTTYPKQLMTIEI